MANVATMGPPPSPKEPRRSGRRPAPSSSKSPAGSPPSEPNPKSKDNTARPSLNTNHSNGRNKRAKNEEFDEPLEEPHPAKNGVTTNGGSARTKRKGKEKDKILLSLLIPNDEIDGNPEVVGDGGVGEAGDGEEEEGGITRCICQKYGACRRVDHPQTCSQLYLQAKRIRTRESSWSNARYARRGSMGSVCTMTPWRACPCCTTAKSAGPTCGQKS